MSDYKKLKKKHNSIADSLLEAADPKKKCSPVGNRDQGDYADMKAKMPVISDNLVGDRPRFAKLKEKMKKSRK